ncbi:hypothetical protein C2S51_009787 [Perilla frutescens var. frutescens]|nr:hypothetical protein C2S51_009787 [Perilla frutescens var. frutescens]
MADDTVMEEREELMVSASGGEAHLRRAHFLKPSITSVNGPVAAACSAGGKGSPPLKVKYVGWGYHPLKKWKEWVGAMHSSHHSTWKRAGILDAIMSSTCFIHRREDLILWLVERWSPTTNSFVFPWGEATITLEDMMVLGGYSVLGDSVFVPRDGEVEEKVTELLGSRLDIYNSGNKRAFEGRWINRFMGSAEMEKEAFLALWLSKFVFPFSCKSAATTSAVVAIAVYLARGIRIALAPAVLASIYRGLTLLKVAVDCVGKKKVEVSAPLALVQVWAWERFPALRPVPKWVERIEPRIARWGGFNHGCRGWWPDEDYGGEDFQWRPYTSGVYMDDERWEIVESGLDEELESYVRCVRVSKVVGVEEECVELYLPNRVSMQFGMDQDIPGHAGGDSVSFESAWRDYIRPIRDAKVYVPPRLSQPRVTARYFEWWKKLNLGEEEAVAAAVSEQLRDQTDVDFMPKKQAILQVAKHHPQHSCLGRGSFKRTKRRYLQQYRRQRIRVPQRVGSRDSVASASNTKAAAFDGKGSSSKSSKGKLVESLSVGVLDHNGSVSPRSAPKREQNKVSELSVCETQGENCILSEARNGNVQHVMSTVEETQVTEQVSKAVIVGPDETIGLSMSRARRALQKLEDRARNLEKIFSLIEAGTLVCLSKGSF